MLDCLAGSVLLQMFMDRVIHEAVCEAEAERSFPEGSGWPLCESGLWDLVAIGLSLASVKGLLTTVLYRRTTCSQNPCFLRKQMKPGEVECIQSSLASFCSLKVQKSDNVLVTGGPGIFPPAVP